MAVDANGRSVAPSKMDMNGHAMVASKPKPAKKPKSYMGSLFSIVTRYVLQLAYPRRLIANNLAVFSLGTL